MDGLRVIDAGALYESTNFTDLSVGQLTRMMPVTADGAPDPSRPERFFSSIKLRGPDGDVEIKFEILKASNLRDAVLHWPTAAKAAYETFVNGVRRPAPPKLVLPS